jgi:GNAT superfamily N-acetyltransferase
MTIRPAAVEDWPAVGDLARSLVDRHHAYDPARFVSSATLPPHDYAARLRADVAHGAATVVVAEIDRTVVGYVFAAIEPANWKELRDEAGYIHDLVVASERRGRGVGTALIDAAFGWFGSRGITRVMLWSAYGNADAQRLFRRAGFRPTMIEMTTERG